MLQTQRIPAGYGINKTSGDLEPRKAVVAKYRKYSNTSDRSLGI